MARDFGNIVASPTPLQDEPATSLSNESLTSRQRIPKRRPSAEREDLSGYANFLRPLSESFSTTYKGRQRSKGSLLGNRKNSLALHLIKELKQSEQNVLFWKKEAQEMHRIAGELKAQGINWEEQGKVKKQELVEAQMLMALNEEVEMSDLAVAEEIMEISLRRTLRQLGLIEGGTGTRSITRDGSDELVVNPPTPGKAGNLDDEVF
jgi:hypothetical protein